MRQPASNGIAVDFDGDGHAVLLVEVLGVPDLKLQASLPLELSGYLEGLRRENLPKFTKVIDEAGRRLRQLFMLEVTLMSRRQSDSGTANKEEGIFQNLFDNFVEGTMEAIRIADTVKPESETSKLRRLLENNNPP